MPEPVERSNLTRIAGDITPLSGWVRIPPATVLVVLRNGAAESVLEPGRTYWRGRKLPLIGGLDGLPVSIASHVESVVVDDVATTCEFHLPQVEVVFEIRLNDSDGWRRLLEYVGSNADNFAERLRPRILNSLDLLVRETLGRRTHRDLYLRNLTSEFELNQTLLKGLFVIEEIIEVRPVWNPAFVEIATAPARTAVKIDEIGRQALLSMEEINAKFQLLPLEHQLELAQLQASLALQGLESQATGVPISVLRNPELLAHNRDQLVDLAKALAENPRAVNSPLIAGILQEFMAASPTGAPAGGPAAGAAHQGPASAPRPPSSLSPAGIATPPLHREPQLDSLLAQHGLDEHVVGFSAASRGERAVALCVTTAPPAELAGLGPAISRLARREVDLFVVPYDASLAPLLVNYLQQRLPELRTATLQFRVVQDRLQIGMALAGNTSVVPVKRTLTDPEQVILQPLQKLLPYESIEVLALER